MSGEENKATVRRYLEEIWNGGDLEVANEIVAPTVVFRSSLRHMEGLDAFKQFVTVVRTVFPDIHFAIEELIAQGDEVVAHWTMTGTQKGDFIGIAATGRQFIVPSGGILWLSEGKVAEAWLFWDPLGLVE